MSLHHDSLLAGHLPKMDSWGWPWQWLSERELTVSNQMFRECLPLLYGLLYVILSVRQTPLRLAQGVYLHVREVSTISRVINSHVLGYVIQLLKFSLKGTFQVSVNDFKLAVFSNGGYD